MQPPHNRGGGGELAKSPQASDLEYGEIAVNYNEGDPSLFIKSSGSTGTTISKFSSDKQILGIIEDNEEVTSAALNNLQANKQDKLTAGSGITIENNIISSTSSGGVEEAPIDGTPYIRQDAGWIGYEYPPLDEPVIVEFTTAGTFQYSVPVKCHYLEMFLVNGGNSGQSARPTQFYTDRGKGGNGGATLYTIINVNPTDDITIEIGDGGAAPTKTDLSYNLGKTTHLIHKDHDYNPGNQIWAPISGNGVNGILNLANPTDTNLYGASGASGKESPTSGTYYGGTTGGGNSTSLVGGNGTFYGAGGSGGGGYTTAYVGGAGYRGYAYLKFT